MLGLSFDMLSMAVFSTRHWQISGRLVQELNVCTVSYQAQGTHRVFKKTNDMDKAMKKNKIKMGIENVSIR